MPASIKNNNKVLSTAKAIAVRKKIRTLNEKSGTLFLSVAVAKKDFEQLKKK